MKSGNLNFVEPSGPLQACNGTTLLYYLMGPPSYMRSIVDRNVVMRLMTVLSRNFPGGTELNHDEQSCITFEVPTDILTRQLHDSHPPQARTLGPSSCISQFSSSAVAVRGLPFGVSGLISEFCTISFTSRADVTARCLFCY